MWLQRMSRCFERFIANTAYLTVACSTEVAVGKPFIGAVKLSQVSLKVFSCLYCRASNQRSKKIVGEGAWPLVLVESTELRYSFSVLVFLQKCRWTKKMLSKQDILNR